MKHSREVEVGDADEKGKEASEIKRCMHSSLPIHYNVVRRSKQTESTRAQKAVRDSLKDAQR